MDKLRWYSAILGVVLGLAVGIGLVFGATQSATLSWDNPAPTDQVVGYHVYRGNLDCSASGPLQPLLDSQGQPVLTPLLSGAANQMYVDNTIPDVSATVCWEIDAYNSAGSSIRSNRVSKQITATTPPVPIPGQPQNLRVTLQ